MMAFEQIMAAVNICFGSLSISEHSLLYTALQCRKKFYQWVWNKMLDWMLIYGKHPTIWGLNTILKKWLLDLEINMYATDWLNKCAIAFWGSLQFPCLN